jgi:hypothetical protein
MTVYTIILAICVVVSGDCRQIELPIESCSAPSLMATMARVQATHPEWRVMRWECREGVRA